MQFSNERLVCELYTCTCNSHTPLKFLICFGFEQFISTVLVCCNKVSNSEDNEIADFVVRENLILFL